ncbi:MAG: hypothetical protein WCJ97_01595 [Phycisphaerae bacterium]
MRQRCSFVLILCLMLVSFGMAPTATTAPAPISMDQIKADMTAKDYPAVISATAALLARTTLPEGFNRGEVLLIKAEAHIQQRQGPTAASTLMNVGKADPKLTDSAAALGALLNKAGAQCEYRVKNTEGKETVYDLRDLTERKNALEVYFTAEWRLVRHQVETASKQTSLPTLAQAARSATRLRPMERGCMGNDNQTQAAVKQLCGQANTAMTGVLSKQETDIKSYDTESHKWLTRSHKNVDPATKKTITIQEDYQPGLTDAQINGLKAILATCEDIATFLKQNGEAFGGLADFKAVMAQAEKNHTAAKLLLSAKFESKTKVIK